MQSSEKRQVVNVGNETATVRVAVLAVPGVQRLLEAVAVRIESRGQQMPANPDDLKRKEGRDVD